MKDYFEMRWMHKHIISTACFSECIDSNLDLNAKLCAFGIGVCVCKLGMNGCHAIYKWKTNCSLSLNFCIWWARKFMPYNLFIYLWTMTFNLPIAHAICTQESYGTFRLLCIVFFCLVNWVDLKEEEEANGHEIEQENERNNALNKNKFAHCFRNSNYSNTHCRENPNIVRQHNWTKENVWLLNLGSMPLPAIVNERHAFIHLYAFVQF